MQRKLLLEEVDNEAAARGSGGGGCRMQRKLLLEEVDDEAAARGSGGGGGGTRVSDSLTSWMTTDDAARAKRCYTSSDRP